MYRLTGEGRRWAKQELQTAPSFVLQPATVKGK
jgi:hypothetical protein